MKTFLLQVIVSLVVCVVGEHISFGVLQLQGNVLMFSGMVVGMLNLAVVLVVDCLGRK